MIAIKDTLEAKGYSKGVTMAKHNPIRRVLILPNLSESLPLARLAIIPPTVHAERTRLIWESLKLSPPGRFKNRRKIWLMQAAPRMMITKDIRKNAYVF